MTIEKMKEFLSAKDEKITVEFKSCINKISDSIYETVALDICTASIYSC